MIQQNFAMSTIRLLLVDDQSIISQGLKAMLELGSDMEVVVR
ncbi:MAG: hypothetical protein CLLPBCKN_006500 [Chroococcidiopsis cubana SAG 39.79]|nr:hypothetical protein [Chroococcidiopsis cubana SAG 39.79]